jgi:hypothetical protein
VRSQKRSEQVRSTYFLESTKRERSQDRNESELEKGITFWKVQIEGKMRTRKESECERGTYILQGKGQDTKRKKVTGSQPGGHRVRDKSEHKKEASKRGELTYWRAK